VRRQDIDSGGILGDGEGGGEEVQELAFAGEETEGDVACSFTEIFSVFEGGLGGVWIGESGFEFGGETGVRHGFIVVYISFLLWSRLAVLSGCCCCGWEVYLGGRLVEGLVWMEEFEGVLFAFSGAVDEVVETDFAVLLFALVTPQRSSLQTS
jgi:hypothetical protein